MIFENFLSITITPGSSSLEINNGEINLTVALIEPTNKNKSIFAQCF